MSIAPENPVAAHPHDDLEDKEPDYQDPEAPVSNAEMKNSADADAVEHPCAACM